jgi:predicted alpha/beta hydrolase family esterase
MQKRVFIIHGWEGNPNLNWFPWLKSELELRGFDVKVPEMPDSNHPEMEAWISHLAGVVGTPDEECYFVGHSLGCITILRYLESLEEGTEVGGAVLVAGFSAGLGIDQISDFFRTPVNWEMVGSRCKKFVAINSDNDPFVPLKYGELFREKLGARLIIKHEGHFSKDVTALPDAVDAILDISG